MRGESKQRKEVDGIPLPDLRVKSGTIDTPVSLHFRFELSGWAIFTASPKLATLNIQSDWGDYAYRWPTGGCGDTPFLEWLARTCQRDPHYITDKLSYDSPALKDKVDEEKTRKAVREALADGDVDAGDLEEWLEELEAWDLGDEVSMVADSPGWVWSFFDGMPPLVHRPSGQWVILQHALIPFFGEQLAAHLEAAKHSFVPPGSRLVTVAVPEEIADQINAGKDGAFSVSGKLHGDPK